MADKQAFQEAKTKYFQTLKQYVPVVARVHGGNHPEFLEVHTVFDSISKKIKETGTRKAVLGEEFLRLREITDNYKVPGDVCETYEAVYHMLAELDKTYHT